MIGAIAKFHLEWDGRQFQTGASIGIAAVDAASANAASVLRRADSACYAAKQSGGNRIRTVTDEAFRSCS
jgi:GGDEF domain-containing protein